jgi:hypothetical protein
MRDGGRLRSRAVASPSRRGMERVRPVLEDNIGGDNPQMLEEAVSEAAAARQAMTPRKRRCGTRRPAD